MEGGLKSFWIDCEERGQNDGMWFKVLIIDTHKHTESAKNVTNFAFLRFAVLSPCFFVFVFVLFFSSSLYLFVIFCATCKMPTRPGRGRNIGVHTTRRKTNQTNPPCGLFHTTIPCQSGPKGKSNEGLFYIPQSLKTGDSSLDGLRTLVGGVLPPAEMQSVYFTAPADWAVLVLSYN